jgi:outer membrane protein assembly factor BamA
LSISFPSISQDLPESVETVKDTVRKVRNRPIVIPIIFYTPETQFAVGVGGTYTFHLGHDTTDARPSNYQFGGIITQLKQIAFYIPFQLYFKRELYNVYGEFSYYRFNYYFFGIGNNPVPVKENYGVTFPRLRLTALRLLCKNLYGGIRYSLDNFDITNVDPGGLLHLGTITGSSGGRVSSLGLTLKYDSRDNIFYPTKGYFAELYAQADDQWTGSNFNFLRSSIDLSAYYSTSFHHTMCLNFNATAETGNPPFYDLSLLGGSRKMRGFYEGRFRDKDLVAAQAEYRMPLFWRIGSAVFVSGGYVAGHLTDLQIMNLHLSYGGGIRYTIDRKQKINLRLDYGITNNGENGLYVLISEAF